MAQTHVSLNVINNFLPQKRIALVGMSREKHNITVSLLKEMEQQGYEVIPVNPNASEIMGHPCFARVQDIDPAPGAALLFTPAAVTETAVRDCAEAGVKRVWLYGTGDPRKVSALAVEFCREHGIDVIPGECPFMFLAPVHGIHRFHRFLNKITGKYPRSATAN